MVKPAELRKKSEKEIQDLILDMKKELLNLRFQKANGQVANTARFRQLKKAIACAKTIQLEKLKQAS